ncbi:MAG TPA: hypothetical protein VGD88_06530 [Opitutaceae bacterium]
MPHDPAFKRPQYLDLLLPDVADTVRAMARQRSCDAEELAQEIIAGAETRDHAWALTGQRATQAA